MLIVKKTIILIFLFFSFINLKTKVWESYNVPAFKILEHISSDKNDQIYGSIGNRFFAFTNDEFFDITQNLPGLNPLSLRQLRTSNDNVLWGASEAGLFRYDPQIDSMAIYNRSTFLDEYYWNYEFLQSINFDSKGNVWFTGRNQNLTAFTGAEFINISLVDVINLKFTGTHNSVVIDSKDNIWLGGSFDKQPIIIKTNAIEAQNEFKYEIIQDNILNELNGEYEFFFIDSQNRLWISTNSNNEIVVMDNGKFERVLIPDSLVDNRQLEGGNENFIRSICEDSNLNIYFFYHTSDYFLKLNKDLTFEKISFYDKVFPDENPAALMSEVKTDNNNNIWIPTHKAVLKYKAIPTSVESETENGLLPDIYVRNIYPNPTSGNFNADLMIFPENINQVKIGVYNYLGIKVLDLTDRIPQSFMGSDLLLNFDVSNLTNGIYYFALTKGGENRVKTLIINK